MKIKNYFHYTLYNNMKNNIPNLFFIIILPFYFISSIEQ